MKITILSGGSGNDSLIKGLKSFYQDLDISIIVNAYDNGKSTGVCRKVTNTLGVSDIRKNHIRMYKALKGKFTDQRLVDFFEGRFDLDSTEPVKSVIEILNKCDIDFYWPDIPGIKSPKEYLIEFFNSASSDISFNNFCVGNILYAQMYKELGYEQTNSFICKLLDIDDFLILNSFDNVYLNAMLDNGQILEDEGDIVELADENRKIINTFYTGDTKYTLNPVAISAVLNCDLLIISTGTFWSSIYPTLQYGQFYKYVEQSHAKKIWAINNEYDKDSYGVSFQDYLQLIKDNLKFNIKDFTFLTNSDAIPQLRGTCKGYNVQEVKMGNISGKHDNILYAKAILAIYYDLLYKKFDKFVFDFDDTLWSRKYLEDEEEHNASIDCVNLANKLGNSSLIISGNNVDTIYRKLRQIYGVNLDKFDIPVWSLSNVAKYDKNNIVTTIDEFKMGDDYEELLSEVLEILGEDTDKLSIYGGDGYTSNIRIKPLDSLTRDILYNYLINNILPKHKKYIAYKTGLSTIDILVKSNSKSKVFDLENLDKYDTLYIGDEIDKGNDRDIAKLCTHSINTTGVKETRMLLKLIVEGL